MLESDSKSNCRVVHLSTHYLAVAGLKVCEMITTGGGAYSLGKTLTFFTSGSPKIVKPLVYIWNGSSVILRNYWFMSDVTHPYNFHCGLLHHDELFVLSTCFLLFFRFHRRGKWITQWCHFGTKVWKGTNTQNNLKQHAICHLTICLPFKTKTKEMCVLFS